MDADADRTRLAWQRYVDTGEITQGLLRDHIFRAWQRCHAHGVSPLAMEARKLSPAQTASLLEKRRDLLDAARPYMRALSLAAGAERHAAMLADENGVLLDLAGDEETIRRTEGFPKAGSLLAEAVAGANGIGTPLAEGAYVELVGPEHFIEGFHVYTCQGLPLRGPDGDVVGALSTSVRRVQAGVRIREILVCAAHGIEGELTRRRLERDVAGALSGARAGAPPLSMGPQAAPNPGAPGARIEDLQQDIVQLQTAARLRLEQAARVVRTGAKGSNDLVLAAKQLIQRFRRQSQLWTDVVFDDSGPPEPVDLQARLDDLAELLGTEASIRGLRVRVRSGPPVRVMTDSRELSRVLFRGLFRALEDAPPESEVDVAIRARPGEPHASVVFAHPDHLPIPFALAVEPS